MSAALFLSAYTVGGLASYWLIRRRLWADVKRRFPSLVRTAEDRREQWADERPFALFVSAVWLVGLPVVWMMTRPPRPRRRWDYPPEDRPTTNQENPHAR